MMLVVATVVSWAGGFGERQGHRTIVAAAHKRSVMRAGVGIKFTAFQREEVYTLRKASLLKSRDG